MVKIFNNRLFFTISFILIILNSYSQNSFLDDINILDQTRNLKLLDSTDKVNRSFFSKSTFVFQNLNNNNHLNLNYGYDFVNNTVLPQNWNDGNMFPAKGWQERHIFGVNIRYNFLDINFQPEWLKVQNLQQDYYPGNPEDGNFMPKYYGSVANVVDNFRQFGQSKIDTFSYGQSRIGFISKYIGVGISNQNIWWGPGKRNSIIFTNNASGFKHYYLGTVQPLKSVIGDIEFNAITGILDTNWYSDPDIPLMRSIWSGGISKKNLNQKKIDAINFSLRLKWIPNLFLGYAYSRQYYKNQENIFGNGYTFFSKDFYKQEFGSLMFKILFEKDFAELYGEIGIQKKAPWPWKFFENNIKPAYIIGFTKNNFLFHSKYFLNFTFELAQFQLMNPKDLFYPDFPYVGGLFNSWYTDFNIKQGYSNQGQLLGSSIGPGSNMQSVNLSINKGFSKIGVQIERIEQNKDFMYIVYYNGRNGQFINGGQKWGYYNKYWVDINTKLYFQFKPVKNIFIAGSIMNTDALNYRWIKFLQPGKKYDESSNLTDKFNVQFQLSLKYLLHAKIQ